MCIRDSSRAEQFDWLEKQGFEVVEHHLVTAETIEEQVEWFARQIAENDFPSDGLVLVSVSYTHLDVYKRQILLSDGVGDSG